jgi:hypothetical protein
LDEKNDEQDNSDINDMMIRTVDQSIELSSLSSQNDEIPKFLTNNTKKLSDIIDVKQTNNYAGWNHIIPYINQSYRKENKHEAWRSPFENTRTAFWKANV